MPGRNLSSKACWSGAACALRLQHRSHLQHPAQALAVHHLGHVDGRQPVVARAGHGTSISAQFDLAVRVLEDVDVAVDQRPALGRFGKQVDHLVVLQRQRQRDLALHAPGEDQPQVIVGLQRSVRIKVTARCLMNPRQYLLCQAAGAGQVGPSGEG